MNEAHHQLVVVSVDGVTTDAELGIDYAAACRDVEVPLMPRTPHHRVRTSEIDLAVS
jgi:hypothetical protein